MEILAPRPYTPPPPPSPPAHRTFHLSLARRSPAAVQTRRPVDDSAPSRSGASSRASSPAKRPPAALPFRPLTPILSPSLTAPSVMAAAVAAADTDGEQQHGDERGPVRADAEVSAGDETRAARPERAEAGTEAGPVPVPECVQPFPLPTWVATVPTPTSSPQRIGEAVGAPALSRHPSRRSIYVPSDVLPPASSSSSSTTPTNDRAGMGGVFAARRATLPALPTPSSPRQVNDFDAQDADARDAGRIRREASMRSDSPRRPPLFHIPTGGSDIEDDADADAAAHSSDSGRAGPRRRAASSQSAATREDDEGQTRERTRRYHALMELLTTEAGFLQDLRVLVTIYLQHLPGPSAASPPSSFAASSLSMSQLTRMTPASSSTRRPSFSSHARINSHVRANSASSATFSFSNPATPSSSKFSHSHSQPPSPTTAGPSAPPPAASVARDAREGLRAFFADADRYGEVDGSAQQLLAFHECFVDELRDAVAPFGLSPDMQYSTAAPGPPEVPAVALEGAIGAVAAAFLAQAARFRMYRAYCARHTEAQDRVRRMQKEHAGEWHAFEQRCHLLVERNLNASSAAADTAAANDLVEFGASQSAHGHGNRHAQEITQEMIDSGAAELDTGQLANMGVLGVNGLRRHSLSSASPSQALKLQQSWWNSSNVRLAAAGAGAEAPAPPATRPGRAHSHSHGQGANQAARLAFLDYLIKPVQRICKYPLLLDQLKGPRGRAGAASADASEEADADAAHAEADVLARVEAAARAMRAVASSVDDARRQEDVQAKSERIASRLVFAAGGGGLSAQFVGGLGPCVLASSLEVIQPLPKAPAGGDVVTAKYLGAFLYAGGYLVLVKVGKGKVYEPKHWFALAGCEIADVDDAEALLPCSLRVGRAGHQLELVASCQREKDIWIAALREALSATPHWVDEPVPSLPALPARGESSVRFAAVEVVTTSQPSDPGPSEPPAISTADTSEPVHSLASLSGDARRAPANPDAPTSAATARPPFTTRQSSSASAKTVLASVAPEAEVLYYVRRSTSQHRQQVERWLLDVVSESCQAARFHAQTRDEELFQVPKQPGAFMSRSNSGLGVAGAMGLAAKDRLTKRQSVVVLKRGNSHADVVASSSAAEAGDGAKASAGRANSRGGRRKAQPLMVTPITPAAQPVAVAPEPPSVVVERPSVVIDPPQLISEPRISCEEVEAVLLSPPAPAQPLPSQPPSLSGTPPMSPPPSSASTPPILSRAPSRAPSPSPLAPPALLSRAPSVVAPRSRAPSIAAELPTPSPHLLSPEEADIRPKRARSVAENVRGIFTSRSSSPSSPSPSSTSSALGAVQEGVESPIVSALKWWSLRRRVQSAPETPGDDSPAAESGALPSDKAPQLLDEPARDRSISNPSPSAKPPLDAGAFGSKPQRRRSLFHYGRRPAEPDLQLLPSASRDVPQRRSIRHVLFSQSPSRATSPDTQL